MSFHHRIRQTNIQNNGCFEVETVNIIINPIWQDVTFSLGKLKLTLFSLSASSRSVRRIISGW